MALFTLGALLANAQSNISIPVTPPPGGADVAMAQAIGYARWAFGLLAVAIAIWWCVTLMTDHHANGWARGCTIVAAIVMAATAPQWVGAIYHPQ